MSRNLYEPPASQDSSPSPTLSAGGLDSYTKRRLRDLLFAGLLFLVALSSAFYVMYWGWIASHPTSTPETKAYYLAWYERALGVTSAAFLGSLLVLLWRPTWRWWKGIKADDDFRR